MHKQPRPIEPLPRDVLGVGDIRLSWQYDNGPERVPEEAAGIAGVGAVVASVRK
ncbi:MAG: hypothetical protein WCI74_17510 [Actinomycetes bacterium]